MKLKIITLLYFYIFMLSPIHSAIMLNPAGDAKNAGRRLAFGYERGIARQFVESLQEQLTKKFNIKTMVSHMPGQETTLLQSRSLANVINVDLFVNISFYKETSPKPRIFLYHMLYNSLVDYASGEDESIKITPFQEAHYKNSTKTKKLVGKLKRDLTNNKNEKLFSFHGPVGAPIKSLMGIAPCAISLEIGLCEDLLWKSLVDSIAESLAYVVG